MSRLRGLVGMGLLLAVAGCMEAFGSAGTYEWTGRVDSDDAVEVKGVNGRITVERAAGDEIEVRAEAEARRSDLRSVHVEVLDHAGGVTFCAVYPTPDGERENYCGAGSDGRMNTRDNDVQVHFFVSLPEGVRFVGQTVNGGVEALGLASDLSLKTVNGDIRVATEGFAEAETVNGSIEAAMEEWPLVEGLEFETVNGSILLDVPNDVDADLEARWVNGGLDSELPLMLTGLMRRGRAEGTFGDGGPTLSVSTVNGSIRVR